MSWRAILDGERSEQALEAVRAIARDLEAIEEPRAHTARLASGTAGFALFFGNAGAALGESEARALADRFLEHAIADLPRSSTLFSGFTGVAFAAQQLARGEDDPNEDLDRVLAQYLEQRIALADASLIYGLAGIGVYALERLPRPPAAQALERVVALLDERAAREPSGIVWRGPAPGASHGPETPRDHVDLGPAHGLPGIVAVLARAAAAGVARGRATALVEGSLRWLEEHAWFSPEGPPCPSAIGPLADPGPARLGWCYGDLGLASSLFVAARALGSAALEARALGIARRAARRPRSESGVSDAGLCHGAAGVGHAFNRLAQASGDEALLAAARAWLERALELRAPGQPASGRERGGKGFGGFRGHYPALGGWIDLPGILEGSAGVGLALLAAATDREPAWDRFLLLA